MNEIQPEPTLPADFWPSEDDPTMDAMCKLAEEDLGLPWAIMNRVINQHMEGMLPILIREAITREIAAYWAIPPRNR